MTEQSQGIAIELSGVSKHYSLYDRPSHRLLQMLSFGRRRLGRNFAALENVSLSIPKGMTIGILGRNGAGKSTLLQIISGILTPTCGDVVVNGRVSALLELGTGFNADFTGRENVFVNAAILGLTQEQIEARLPAIQAFADIGEFIDQPVKTYSSGMFVRLAFAVAIHVDPEILIIDEALAVGDVKFQAKCFRKFEELQQAGKTILFVSHSVEQVVRHCERAYLLDAGRLVDFGEPKKIANRYLDLLFDVRNEPISDDVQDELAALEAPPPSIARDRLENRPGYNSNEFRWGSRAAEIEDVILVAESASTPTNHFSADEDIEIQIRVKFHQSVEQPIFGLTVKTPDGIVIYGTNSRDAAQGGVRFSPEQAGSEATVVIRGRMPLVEGHYLVSVGVADQGDEEEVPLDRRYDVLHIFLKNARRVYGLADFEMQFHRSHEGQWPRSISAA